MNGLTAIATLALLLSGCKKEQITSYSPDSSVEYYAKTTQGDCINGNTGNAYSVDFPGQMVQGSNSYNYNIEVYNTLTDIVYVFTTDANISCLKRNDINGTSVYSGPLVATYTYSVPLSATWQTGDVINATFWINRQNCNGLGGGVALAIATSYTLLGVCTSTELTTDYSGNTECGPIHFTATTTADGNFTGGTVRLQVYDGISAWTDIATEVVGDGVLDFDYSPAPGTYTLRAFYDGTGSNHYEDSYSDEITIEVIACCDDADFDYTSNVVTNNNNEEVYMEFTYNHGEEVTSVSIDFTFPQIAFTLPNGPWTSPIDGKNYMVTGNGTVFHWTGAISCKTAEAETFKFQFAPDCGPSTAKDGRANIWTDAKVVAINGTALVDNLNTPEYEGPYSVKGSLSNIVYTGCPQ